jgi:hypothetical protein
MPTLYSPPKLAPRTQTAIDNGEFDFLLPYRKPFYRVDEVSEAIGGFAHNFVRALIDAGKLEAHRHGSGEFRKVAAVTRRSVLLYLAETANYDPTFLVIRIEALLKNLNRPALIRLVNTATKRLNQID